MKVNLLIDKDDFYGMVIPLAEKHKWNRVIFWKDCMKLRNQLIKLSEIKRDQLL